MKYRLKDVDSILARVGVDVDAAMIINREGIVEFVNLGEGEENGYLPDFFCENVIGRHVLDNYYELDEVHSSVMKALKTGDVVESGEQNITWGNIEISLTTTSYPIMADDGYMVHCVVDLANFQGVKRKGSGNAGDDGLFGLEDVITVNPEMIKLKSMTKDLADTGSNVLIIGETGTGKELFAQALHSISQRRNQVFISQNCGAIPENLVESLFFGTEKGAFTGAERRQGLFELADGGTLFLDEVNSLDTDMQAKLLKVIEEQRIRRIGGIENVKFDVRLVCATNEDPEQLVREGRLRSDLYYRINVVEIDIPPLRERPEDIPLLTEHFISLYNGKMNRKIEGVSQLTGEFLKSWVWPGNVRELKNTIERAFNIEKGNTIKLDSVRDRIGKMGRYMGEGRDGKDEEIISKGRVAELVSAGDIELDKVLEDCERVIIQTAMNEEKKLVDVARKLSISPQKLQYRLDKLKIR